MRKFRDGKRPSSKLIDHQVWANSDWTVHYGELRRSPGRPKKVARLFKYIGEKIPYSALDAVRKHFSSDGATALGVYVAHDSMGTPRYIGRGQVFSRLKAHKKRYSLELAYFSFYIVEDRQHEREIETLLIRAAGDQLEFNDRKRRVGIMPGNIRDYEPGTEFYERHYKKGRRARKGFDE